MKRILFLLFSVILLSCNDNTPSIAETTKTDSFSNGGGTRSFKLSDDVEWTGFFNLKINGIPTEFNTDRISVEYTQIDGVNYVTSIKTDWFYIEKISNDRISYSIEPGNTSRYFTVEILYNNKVTELFVSQNLDKDGSGDVVTKFPTTVNFTAEGGMQSIVSKNVVSNWWFYALRVYDEMCSLNFDNMKETYPSWIWLNTMKSTLMDSKMPWSYVKVESDWFSYEKLNDYTIRIDMTPTDTLRIFRFDVYLGNTRQIITVTQSGK